jgi:DNA-binding SARP family transcriptional activator
MTARRLAQMVGRLARGLLGLAASVTLLAGIPWGLWHWVGWPLPHTIPTWAEVSAALTSNGVPDELVINALAILVWIAWADLCLAVAVETAALVGGRKALRLPLAGPLQPLAAHLVAAVMLLVPQGSLRATTPFPPPVAVVRTVQQAISAPQPPGAADELRHAVDTRNLPAAPSATTPSSTPRTALLRYTVRAADPARGVKRDTLWGIAERFLGDGRRYPEIYQLNKGRPQPDGGRLTDPDRIWPGWVLDLPADATDCLATPGTPPAPQRSTPPAAASPAPDRPPDTTTAQGEGAGSSATRPTTTTRHQDQPPARPLEPTRPGRPAIDLPGGGVVGPTLAAAIAAALALAFLHRRRRYHPTTPRPGMRHTDPLITPTVRRLLRAATGADQVDPDGEPTVAGPTINASGNGAVTPPRPAAVIPLAQDEHTEASIDLAVGGLGLLGPCAPAAARAIITILLTQARPDTVEVLLAGTAVAVELLGPTIPLPGLTITDDLAAALDVLEVELLRRSRLLANQDLADVAAYAAFDPAEPLPTVVLVADGRQQPLPPRLNAVLVAGRRLGITAVLLGTNPAGPTITADPAGRITRIHPDAVLAELVGARLYTLNLDETLELLRVITAAGGAEPPTAEPAPVAAAPEPTTQPVPTDPPAAKPTTEPTIGRPVEVRMLGPLQIRVHGRQLSKGLRTKAPELLAYLLVHPAGVTRDAAIEALWPELDPDRGVAWFKAVLGNLRRALSPAEPTDTPVIPRIVDRYQANPDLIGCDLWRFQHALTTAADASDPAATTAALQQALAAYHGDLVEGTDYDWALTEREDLRRQAITAAARLADLHQQAGEPQRALDVLDRAVRWDSYHEQLYQQLMRAHAQLGHPEEIRRTYRRLELRMADLDDDPSEATRQLRDQLLRAARARGHPAGQ